ncbi:ferrous iron transport protein A [Granulicatella balaenopterae]|uniref:Ferrous iron transport protein A n=1 Tax=Granulicatella balaenopterae TaxID=137733 RepID=A0A1H9NK29_9LACT|nr:FeoA family protein [Granulicatella balaenopterae]SER36009.1 ferrous iron transport protein A [Granulicatella balaenopterae]
MKIFELPTQKTAIVKSVTHPSEQMQQRLYDLGIYPGGKVKLVLISPKDDPKAYEVRGTVIALRNEDAQYIDVELGDEANGK